MSHYPERIENVARIVKDLNNGTRKPDEIIIFVDNDDIDISIDGVTVIRSNKNYDVISRLYAATFATSEYLFMIDDDITVEAGTLAHFEKHAEEKPFSVLGFEGTTMKDNDAPYTKGNRIPRGDERVLADVLVRIYFCSKKIIALAIYMHELYREGLDTKYTDDIILCLSNRYLSNHSNWVIPVEPGKGTVEISNGGVGLSLTGGHYGTRNETCRLLMNKFKRGNV